VRKIKLPVNKYTAPVPATHEAELEAAQLIEVNPKKKKKFNRNRDRDRIGDNLRARAEKRERKIKEVEREIEREKESDRRFGIIKREHRGKSDTPQLAERERERGSDDCGLVSPRNRYFPHRILMQLRAGVGSAHRLRTCEMLRVRCGCGLCWV